MERASGRPPGAAVNRDSKFFIRIHDVDPMRSLMRASAWVGVLLGLDIAVQAVWIRDSLAHPNAYLASGLAGAIAAVMLLLGSYLASDDVLPRVYVPATLMLLFGWAIAIPAMLTFAGFPAFASGSVGYGILLFIAASMLSRVGWVLLIALLISGYALISFRAADMVEPTAQIVFIFFGMIVTAIFMNHSREQLDDARRHQRETAEELAALNANLERRVEQQVGEVERLGRLRRFLAAPVADAVLTADDQSVLSPHRREIAVLFCDLRGFTAFAKQVEPEEVMEVLDAYYAAAGEQITRFEATLGSFEGDGLMAYLNDPIPCDDPAIKVIEMGMAIAEAIDVLESRWTARGYKLSYGIGMAMGHATLGVVGFDGRSDYTAVGTVVNLGARLCSAAAARELLVDHRIYLQAGDRFALTGLEPRELKGFAEPVRCYLVDR